MEKNRSLSMQAPSGKASIKIVYKKDGKTVVKMFENVEGTIVKSVM